MRKIVAVITLFLILLMLSLSSMNTAHAATTGTFSWSWQWTGTHTLSNGTKVYSAEDTFVYKGPFSGSSNATEKDYSHPDGSASIALVETFTGSFNGSKQGSIGFQGVGYIEGYGEANYVAVSFSHGTGGLAGLQGTLTRQSPGGICGALTACTFTGTYTVTSATWGTTPVPEFSNLAFPIVLGFFASIVCLTVLKRKETT